MNQIEAPFNDAQIQALNENQCGAGNPLTATHPFTCANCRDRMALDNYAAHLRAAAESDASFDGTPKSQRIPTGIGREGGDLGVMIATPSGWVCPYCGGTRDWAWSGMATPSDLTPPFPPEQSEARTAWQIGLADPIRKRIAAYEALYKDPQYWFDAARSDEQNASGETRRAAIEVMIACLRRTALALDGIETRPGMESAISSSNWIPADGEHKPSHLLSIDILYHSGSTPVNNPLHPGYGPNAWIRRDHVYRPEQYVGGGIVLPCETGMVTHWRPSRTASPAVTVGFAPMGLGMSTNLGLATGGLPGHATEEDLGKLFGRDLRSDVEESTPIQSGNLG